MVRSVLPAGLTTVYQQLTAFAGLESFWTNFDSIFGTEYNLAVAQSLRSQWQSGNFSQLPTIEVIDDVGRVFLIEYHTDIFTLQHPVLKSDYFIERIKREKPGDHQRSRHRESENRQRCFKWRSQEVAQYHA